MTDDSHATTSSRLSSKKEIIYFVTSQNKARTKAYLIEAMVSDQADCQLSFILGPGDKDIRLYGSSKSTPYNTLNDFLRIKHFTYKKLSLTPVSFISLSSH